MPKGISTKADLHHPKPSRKTLLIIDKKRVDLSKKKRNTSIKGPESLLKDIKSRNHIGKKEKRKKRTIKFRTKAVDGIVGVIIEEEKKRRTKRMYKKESTRQMLNLSHSRQKERIVGRSQSINSTNSTKNRLKLKKSSRWR